MASTSMTGCSCAGGKAVRTGGLTRAGRLIRGSFLELDILTSPRRKDSIHVSSMNAVGTPIGRNRSFIFSASLVDVLLCSCTKDIGPLLILRFWYFVERIDFLPSFSSCKSFKLGIRVLLSTSDTSTENKAVQRVYASSYGDTSKALLLDRFLPR